MRICLMMLMTAGLLAAAPICSFECLSPGAANQSVCAPVAAHIDADWTAPTLTINYDAYNGTIIENLIVVGTSFVTAFDVYIHSNGGTWSTALPGAPESITAYVRGIGGPDRITVFAADCCTPTPEPRGTAGAGLLALAGALHIAGRRKRHWGVR